MRIIVPLLVLALTACSDNGSSGVRDAVANAGTGMAHTAVGLAQPEAETDELRQARQELARRQAELAAAQALVAELEHQAAQARLEGLRRILAWASGLAILGMLVCAALAVWLPVFRKRLGWAAAACAAVLLLAQAVGPVLAWLPLIGVGLVLVALAAVAGALWLRLRAAVRSVDAAVDRDDPTWPAMREHLMHAQGGEGRAVQRDLDRIARRERARIARTST